MLRNIIQGYVLLVILAAIVHAETFTCSCTPSELENLISQATDGDTINIAPGVHNWNNAGDNGVVIDKAITISGGGSCDNCGDTANPSGNWPVTIDIGNSENQAFVIRAGDSSEMTRITGLKFNGRTRFNYDWWSEGPGGFIVVSTDNSAEFRIDSNYFHNTAPGSSYGACQIIANTYGAYGLIDNNYMENTGSDGGMIQVHRPGYIKDGDGWESFAEPAKWGSGDFLFVEDNTFTFGCDSDPWGPGIVDSYAGGRYVMRHNYVQNGFPLTHDLSGGGWVRSGPATEIYNNIMEWSSCSCESFSSAILIRGGSFLIHNNDFIGNWQDAVRVNYGRLGGSQGNWGHCGDNPWDGSGGYPCIDQPGRLQTPATSDENSLQPQELEPVRIWSNTKDSGIGWMQNNIESIFKEGQDYYMSEDGSAMPVGYSTYTYPHPLASGGSVPVTCQDLGYVCCTDDCLQSVDAPGCTVGVCCDMCVATCVPMTVIELQQEIGKWQAGQITIVELMETIAEWKSGC